jgi:outer membrane protein assembly factor BamB
MSNFQAMPSVKLGATARSRAMGRALTIASAVAITATISGCGWFGRDKLKPLPELKSSAISLQWSASAGKPGRYLFGPAAGEKVIYTAAHDGTVNVIADDGGRNVTRLDAKAKLTAGVGAAEDFIVVASEKGDIIAMDSTGKSLWRTPLTAEVLAQPVVSGANVIIRTADGRMVALSRADGKRRWIFTRAAPPLILRTNANVIVNRGIVYAGYPGGRLVAVELESGRPIWEATISVPRGATELERVADVAGLPVHDDTRVCAAVYQGRTGCVETLNGNVLWSREISSADGVAVDGKFLFVADTDGNIFALDKTNGSTVWKQEALQKRDPGTPVLLKNILVTVDKNGVAHALDTQSGDLVGRVATDGARATSMQVIGGRAIVQTEKGGLYAIAGR